MAALLLNYLMSNVKRMSDLQNRRRTQIKNWLNHPSVSLVSCQKIDGDSKKITSVVRRQLKTPNCWTGGDAMVGVFASNLWSELHRLPGSKVSTVMAHSQLLRGRNQWWAAPRTSTNFEKSSFIIPKCIIKIYPLAIAASGTWPSCQLASSSYLVGINVPGSPLSLLLRSRLMVLWSSSSTAAVRYRRSGGGVFVDFTRDWTVEVRPGTNRRTWWGRRWQREAPGIVRLDDFQSVAWTDALKWRGEIAD